MIEPFRPVLRPQDDLEESPPRRFHPETTAVTPQSDLQPEPIPGLYYLIGLQCRNVLFNRITVTVPKPTASVPVWKPRTGVPFFPVAVRLAAKSSLSATRGNPPSLVFRNVSVCCVRKT